MTVTNLSRTACLAQDTAGLKHRSQVRSGQVNRKNIFLPRKLTIFNSKLTRYEKESVIMRGMWLYAIKSVQTERKQRISRANCFLPCCPRLGCLYPPFLWLLTMCSQDKSRDDRTYRYCHNLFNLFNLYFSLFSLITLSIIQVVWGGEYLH